MNNPGKHWLGFLVGLLARRNDSLIESIFGFAPAAKAALAFTEYKITALAPLLMLENGEYRRGRRYDVLATVLGPSGGKLIMLRSKLISDQRKSAISRARCPVKISSLTIALNRFRAAHSRFQPAQHQAVLDGSYFPC